MDFACLGVALALYGRHAVRARVLNVASAGASVFVNVIAAAPGWRDLAVWAMPPAAYALASDTLIGVVRAWVIARHQEAAGLAAGDATLLAVAGGLLLWLLRLGMAPASTLSGFRTGCWRNAPSPRAAGPPAQRSPTRTPPGPPRPPLRPRPLLSRRHGEAARAAQPRRPGSSPWSPNTTGRWPLSPLNAVSKISAATAPQVNLNAGAARAALRRAVLAAQKEGAQ